MTRVRSGASTIDSRAPSCEGGVVPADPVTVLVVDDDAAFLRAAADLVCAVDAFELVGTASSAEQALSTLEDRPCQVVLMDIHLPGMSGIEACRRLRSQAPEMLVVVMSVGEKPDLVNREGLGGAVYVSKAELGPEALAARWADWRDRRSSS
jgi:two-component system, NarL family, invasion response regulator UvrY